MDMFAPLNFIMNRVRMIESREEQLGRAEQLGFNTSKVWYHGSKIDFERFRKATTWRLDLGPGIYLTSDPDLASQYSGMDGLRKDAKNPLGPSDRPQVYPVFIRNGPIWRWDSFMYHTPKNRMMLDAIKRYIALTGSSEEDAYKMIHTKLSAGVDRGANTFLKSLGYIGAMDDDSAHTSQIVVFDSKNIRSIFGAFQKSKGKLHETA